MGKSSIWSLLLVVTIHGVWSEIRLEQSPSEVKRPGETVKMSCIISGFDMTSYNIHWIRQKPGRALEWIGWMNTGNNDASYASSFQSRFSMTEDVPSSTQFLQIQTLTAADSAVYFNHCDYYAYFDYWGKGTMVTVTTATSSKPTVFPLMQCGSQTGNTVTLGCLATGFSPSSVTYAWSKAGTAFTDFIQYPPVEKSGVYTGISQIKVNKEDLDAKQPFKCIASNIAGNGEGTFIVTTPIYKEPTLKVFSSYDGGEEVSFSCFAKDFAPKQYEFKWLKNDGVIPHDTYVDQTPAKEKKTENGTLYSAASFLTVPASEWTQDTKYVCEFKGKGLKGPVYKNASVSNDMNDGSNGGTGITCE
ncbi:Ig heavy chain Mem5-like [Labrus mixtus]|uniref:Ig heavy chain Mem5-like n=1 Tax=Labrus mixtus TaxID=508554 RepID=UPI0029C0F55F|nr:Ig heavy chain Mem5-like [Labrus mixtus]